MNSYFAAKIIYYIALFCPSLFFYKNVFNVPYIVAIHSFIFPAIYTLPFCLAHTNSRCNFLSKFIKTVKNKSIVKECSFLEKIVSRISPLDKYRKMLAANNADY